MCSDLAWLCCVLCTLTSLLTSLCLPVSQGAWGRVLCTCSSSVRNEQIAPGRRLPSAWEFRATVSGRSPLESRLPLRRHLEGYLLEWRRKLTLLGSILTRPEVWGLNPEFERAIKAVGSCCTLKPVVVFLGTREVFTPGRRCLEMETDGKRSQESEGRWGTSFSSCTGEFKFRVPPWSVSSSLAMPQVPIRLFPECNCILVLA